MERHTSIQYGRKELGSYKVAASILTPSRNVSEHCKRIVISLSSRMKIKMKTISGVEMDEMGIDRQPLRVDFPWRLLERLTASGTGKRCSNESPDHGVSTAFVAPDWCVQLSHGSRRRLRARFGRQGGVLRARTRRLIFLVCGEVNIAVTPTQLQTKGLR